MITITFNGKDFALEEGVTLQSFLEQNSLLGQKIAIEVDLEVVPGSSYSSLILHDKMKIEAIAFVGGG